MLVDDGMTSQIKVTYRKFLTGVRALHRVWTQCLEAD